MSSINNLIVRAEKVGRYAADLAHDGSHALPPTDKAHHPGDDTGRLALEAFRNHGIEEMKSVIIGYQRGYNARAQELGDVAVRWAQIRKGIAWALPGATKDEEEAIKAGMDL